METAAFYHIFLRASGCFSQLRCFSFYEEYYLAFSDFSKAQTFAHQLNELFKQKMELFGRLEETFDPVVSQNDQNPIPNGEIYFTYGM